MNTLAIKTESRIIELSFTSDSLRVILADGREVTVPLEWFPCLRDAKEYLRNN